MCGVINEAESPVHHSLRLVSLTVFSDMSILEWDKLANRAGNVLQCLLLSIILTLSYFHNTETHISSTKIFPCAVPSVTYATSYTYGIASNCRFT